MTDYVPEADVHALLDRAEREAERGKYESAARIYSTVTKAVLDMSVDHEVIDETTRSTEIANLALLHDMNSGKALYEAVTDWYSDLRSDYDVVLEPRDGDGPGGDGPGGDGPGGRRYGSKVGVDIEMLNADDAVVTPDEDYDPEYVVSMESPFRESEEEAREYLRQTLEDSDGIRMEKWESGTGVSWDRDLLGEIDLSGLSSAQIDEIVESGQARYDVRDDRVDWKYTLELDGIYDAVDWSIDDAGRYQISASFVDGSGSLVNGARGGTRFYVDSPDTDVEGGVQAFIHRGEATDEAEEIGAQTLGDPSGGLVETFFSMFNGTSNPNYTVELRKDGADEADMRRYLEELEGIEVRVIQSEDRISIGDDRYRPMEVGEEGSIELEYDPSAGEGEDGAFVGPGVTAEVDLMGGSAFVDNPLDHTFSEEGQYDLGVKVYEEDDGAVKTVERTWGGFDVDGMTRWEIVRDIAATASYLNHGAPSIEGDEEEEAEELLLDRARQGVKQRGGVMGTVNQFLQLDADEISNHMAGDVLWNLPPFSAFKGRFR